MAEKLAKNYQGIDSFRPGVKNLSVKEKLNLPFWTKLSDEEWDGLQKHYYNLQRHKFNL